MAKAKSKGLFQSKTFWGVVLMLFAGGAKSWLGIDLDELTQEDITTEVITIVGSILAIWGRVKATRRIDGLS